MWYTLGHTYVLASDQIHSLCWSIWCVILRYLDRFMLSSFHTWAKPPSRMFWHQDLTFYLWLLLLIDYGAIDTLGLIFLAYLDDLGYLPTFHFVLRHFTLDTFMLSILPELDHYLFSLAHTSHHDTWPHIPFSIRRRCRSVLDFLSSAFIHLVDFGFNIFHDGRAW